MAVSMLALLLVIISSFGNGLGSMFFKLASSAKKSRSRFVAWVGLKSDSAVSRYLSYFTNMRFLLGASIYGTAAILYVIALRFEDISILYPIAAMQYVWSAVFAVKYFNERLNSYKVVGIILIIAGAALIGMGF